MAPPLRFVVADGDDVTVTLHFPPDGAATLRVQPGSVLFVDRAELEELGPLRLPVAGRVVDP